MKTKCVIKSDHVIMKMIMTGHTTCQTVDTAEVGKLGKLGIKYLGVPLSCKYCIYRITKDE